MNNSSYPQFPSFPFTDNRLRVFLFNVGQGDHILLSLPNGKFGIIDFFYEEQLNTAEEPPALTYLKLIQSKLEKEKKKHKIHLSFVCLSHYDSDHRKGIDLFFNWIQKNKINIDHFWLSGTEDQVNTFQDVSSLIKKQIDTISENDLFQSILDHFNQYVKWDSNLQKFCRKPSNPNSVFLHGIKRLTIESIDENLYGFCLAPTVKQIDDFKSTLANKVISTILLIVGKADHSRNLGSLFPQKEIDKIRLNNNFISSLIVFKQLSPGNVNDTEELFTALFGGDILKSVWRHVIKEYPLYKQDYGAYDSDFIKASHHGAESSSFPELWPEIVKTDKDVFVGISAGSSPHHPNPVTIKHIRDTPTATGTTISINSTNEREDDPIFTSESINWLSQAVTENWLSKKHFDFDTLVKKVEKKAKNEDSDYIGLVYEFPNETDEEKKIKVKKLYAVY